MRSKKFKIGQYVTGTKYPGWGAGIIVKRTKIGKNRYEYQIDWFDGAKPSYDMPGEVLSLC